MKSLTIISLFVPLIFASCEQEKVVNENALPAAEQQYLDTHFPAVGIEKVVQHRMDNKTSYDVWLQNRIEVKFDIAGQVAAIDGHETEHLPDSVIPGSIRDYVQSRYAGQYVVEWEREGRDQEVGLVNGTELIFDLNGVFLRVDD